MKTISKMFLTIGTLNCLSPVQADIGKVCNAALSQGLRDNYETLRDQEIFESYQNRLCEAKYQNYQSFNSGATKVGLSVPLAEELLDIGGDSQSKNSKFSEKYSKFCAASYSETIYRSRFQQRINTVSSVLANNWRSCHELHLSTWLKDRQLGLYIDVVPQPDYSQFTVQVKNRTQIAGKNVMVLNISPANGVLCSRGGNPIIPGETEIESNTFEISCTKHPVREIQFSMETNAGPSNVVEVPSESDKIAELRQQINDVKYQAEKNSKRIDRAKVAIFPIGTQGTNQSYSVETGFAHKSAKLTECPAGQYMAGIQVSYSGTCKSTCSKDNGVIKGMSIVCKKLDFSTNFITN